MNDIWTTQTVADELFHILPFFGRLVAHHIESSGEEKATLMQTRALFFLLERPLTTSELARKRKISMQSASVLVQNMVERGWVTRTPDPNDRRRSTLDVTPEGMARAEQAKAYATRYLAELLSDLSPEEISAAEVFLPALKKLIMKHYVTDDELDESA
jgi:DNA-binding MarR family transcriptional regulator